MKYKILSSLFFGLLLGLTPVLISQQVAWADGELEARIHAEGWETLHALQEGNRRFSSGKNLTHRSKVHNRAELAHEQLPRAVVLSCSDSRVPPELVFDQGLGELFSIRTAGHVIGSASVASAEYAITHLGTKLIIVMGHESCGAVKAALSLPESSAGSPDLDRLLAKIRPNIKSFIGKKVDPTLRGPVQANVEATVAQLLDRSTLIRNAVNKRQVMIVQAVYHLSGGQVEFWEVNPKLTPSENRRKWRFNKSTLISGAQNPKRPQRN